jgi:hypothetical protein
MEFAAFVKAHDETLKRMPRLAFASTLAWRMILRFVSLSLDPKNKADRWMLPA